MKYSLLYKTEEEAVPSGAVYDLSIDRAVANICSDTRRSAYFCSVISKPLCNIENITYRSEILSDFLALPGLLESAKTVFSRYDKMKSDWLELKGAGDTRTADKGTEAMLDYTYSSLKVTALFPKTILSFFYSVFETLSEFDIKSPGLCAVRDYAGEMTKNESLNEIARIASLFLYNSPADYDFEIICSLSDSLNVIQAEICNVKKRESSKHSLIDKLIKKKKSGMPQVVCTEEAAKEDAYFILGESLYQIDRVLEEITDNIYSTFYGIARELDFYEVACTYVNFLQENSPVLCTAKMHSDNSFMKFSALYDFLLLSEGKKKLSSNDVNFDGHFGALIKGKNNTGKTTFLRSLGTAQLFSQAGLPIPAESADLMPFGAVFTHFASAEEEFCAGDTAGRFEGEVRAVSEIMNSLQPCSLILFNETFQTTSYGEGASAICDILKALIKSGCRFVFVTHLTELFDLFDESVIKLESDNGENPFTIKTI